MISFPRILQLLRLKSVFVIKSNILTSILAAANQCIMTLFYSMARAFNIFNSVSYRKLESLEIVTVSVHKYNVIIPRSRADPGFPVGGGANPPEGGANLQFCHNFPKNCMKLRKFWAVGVNAGASLLDLPLTWQYNI